MLLRKIIPDPLFEALKTSGPARLLYRQLMKRSAYLVNCEVTTRCNLSCRMCSRPKWLKDAEPDFKVLDMPQEVVTKVLDGIEQVKDRALVFMTNGLGEPLLYPKLFELIEAVRSRAPGIKFSLTTNAVLLDGDMARRLINSGVEDITISVNAADRKSYADLMGADQYDTVVKNTLGLITLRKELGKEYPHISIQFLQTRLTAGSRKQFHEFWKEKIGRQDKIFSHEPVNHAGAVDTQSLAPSKKAVAKYPCSQCWSRIAIRVNGDTYACDASYYACRQIPELLLGNVLKDSFNDMFFGENAKVKKIRDKQLRGDYTELGPCAICDTFRLTPNAFFYAPLLKRKWR